MTKIGYKLRFSENEVFFRYTKKTPKILVIWGGFHNSDYKKFLCMKNHFGTPFGINELVKSKQLSI